MVRGSGKFKTKRGGGRNFSRNLEPLDNDRSARDKNDDDDDDDDSSSESEDDDVDGTGVRPQPGPLAASGSEVQEPELTRAERRAQKKAGKPVARATAIAEGESEEEDEDGDALINSNRVAAKSTKLAKVGAEPVQLSRREREEKEKKEAKERYWKLHQAGKTDEAKSDLARLAAIRKEREQAAAQRKAETAARDAEVAAKLAASKQKR